MKFERVNSDQALDDLLNDDAVLFKHSERCGISKDRKQALSEMDDDVTIHAVEVREQRSLSDRIEDETGVEHESPQLLVIRDGDVVWHASHTAISPDDLRKHL